MKKFADRKRRPTNYKEGDMVLVKFNPRQFKALRGMHHNLVRKYEGPFKIVAKVGKISYRLELPPHFKIHPVFHASVLKPYHEDKDDPSRNKSQRAPITVTASHDREIEAIIDYQAKRKRGQQASAMFLVHWKGQTPVEATWEKYKDLWQFKDKIQEFLQQCVAVVASWGGGDCDVPPSIQAERHPTRQPAGAAGAGEQADHAGQQPRGPAAAEEAAVSAVMAVTAVSAVTLVSGAAVTGVTSL